MPMTDWQSYLRYETCDMIRNLIYWGIVDVIPTWIVEVAAMRIIILFSLMHKFITCQYIQIKLLIDIPIIVKS